MRLSLRLQRAFKRPETALFLSLFLAVVSALLFAAGVK